MYLVRSMCTTVCIPLCSSRSYNHIYACIFVYKLPFHLIRNHLTTTEQHMFAPELLKTPRARPSTRARLRHTHTLPIVLNRPTTSIMAFNQNLPTFHPRPKARPLNERRGLCYPLSRSRPTSTHQRPLFLPPFLLFITLQRRALTPSLLFTFLFSWQTRARLLLSILSENS